MLQAAWTRKISPAFRFVRNGTMVVIGAGGLILILQISTYFLGVYFEVNRGKETECMKNMVKSHSDSNSSRIHKRIHQIYFTTGNKTMPAVWKQAQSSWKKHHPDCEYTLWDNRMFETFLKTYYPELVSLYNRYSHWVMQTDAARFIILHHFGGVYADLDIKILKPVIPLFDLFTHEIDALLYSQPPSKLGGRMMTDFIIARPGSDFIAHVICGLEFSQRPYLLPYVAAFLTAGPEYLDLKYRTYGKQSHVKLISLKEAVQYIYRIKSFSWLDWDGILIRWIYDSELVFNCLTRGCCIILILYMLYRQRVYARMRGLFCKKQKLTMC